MSVIALPRVRRGSFTSIPEWEAFMDEDELSVEERLGPRSTWLSQARADPSAFNGRRVAHQGAIWVDTPLFEKLRQKFREILLANYAINGVKIGVAVDSPLGSYGKTIFVARLLREYEAQVREFGRRWPPEPGTNDVHRPTIFTTCSSAPRASRGDEAILTYLRAPGWENKRVSQYTPLIKKYVLGCDASAIVLDDIQELRRWRLSDEEMSGHLKYLMSLLPVQLILVGWQLVENKILTEGADGYYRLRADAASSRRSKSRIGAVIASTSSTQSRFIHLLLPGYEIEDDRHRLEWQFALMKFEDESPLLEAARGMLSSAAMSDYLWERTSGAIGSLSKLLMLGTIRAINRGMEHLDADILESVEIDEAAELKRSAARTRLESLTAALEAERAAPENEDL
jgi:hypothetical protein